MKKAIGYTSRFTCVLQVLLPFTSAAYAQATVAAPQERDAGEIVVTATRREQSLQDVPLAVAAISGDTLRKAHVTSFQDLVRVAPSLNVQSFGAAATQFIIRGIASDTAATTGIYLDETPLLGGPPTGAGGDGAPGLRLIDVERAEVLRGPQGTLFGSGSMAGTVRIITNKPQLGVTSGNADVSIAAVKGGTPFEQGSVMLNLPLSDNLAIRAVGWNELGGGFIDQRFDGKLHHNVNDAFVRGGRLSALWQPTDRLSLLALATHQEITIDGTQSYNKGNGPYLSSAYSTEPYKDNYDLYSLTGTYDLGFGKLMAIGSYSNYQYFWSQDTTASNLSFGIPGVARYQQGHKFSAYTGELRFASEFEGPVQIIGGVYYENDKYAFSDASVEADPATGNPNCNFYDDCVAMGAEGFSGLQYATNKTAPTEQYAAYGQADWEIMPKLTATVGGRYFHAVIKTHTDSLVDIFNYSNGLPTIPTVINDSRVTNHKLSYNFALRYAFTPDVSVYARAASGFRIGGVNDYAAMAGSLGINIPSSFGPDSLWDYEAGIKASLFDRKIFLEWSAYQIDWTGQQLPGVDPSGGFQFTLNAGRTRVRGSEAQITARPVHGLSLSAGATYTDAKLAADLPQVVLDAGVLGFKGDRLPRTPKFSFNVNGEYVQDMTANLSAYFGGSVSYHGTSLYLFESDPSQLKLRKYTLVNARVGIRTGPFDASVFADNITNTAAEFGLAVVPDGPKSYPTRPRTIGIRLSGSF
jgi:outer membrane receptor protein involved in Fe transport